MNQAAQMLGLQIHALVFVVAMVILFAINVWTGSPLWVLWVLLGWGSGLLAHWWCTPGAGARKAGS